MDATHSNLLYLWPRRTLFIGRVQQPIRFSQAAASLVMGIDGPVVATVAGEAEALQSQSLLLAPGQRVLIDTSGKLVAACYLDAVGQDFRLLKTQMKPLLPGIYGQIPGESGLLALMKDLHRSPMTLEAAYHALESRLNPGAKSYPEADPRIEKVVTLIQRDIATNLTAEMLANEVNLSVSRLVELFREQVGVPIRRYRQWHRLFVTFTGVQQGKTLTDAALAAGFTDSAHFSHTFRLTLGMKPSDILAMLSGRLYVDTGSVDAAGVTPAAADPSWTATR